MKDYAERIELDLHRVPDVAKVDLLGLQEEKIWIELSNTKLATLGVPLQAVQQAIDAQNAVAQTSFFETGSDRVQLRVSGGFDSVEEIRDFPIRANDRTFRLGDVATVRRGFADPAAPRMRFLGDNAIGIAVSMKPGGDIVQLGSTLEAEFGKLQKTLPVGMKLSKVSDQPAAVRDSVAEFVRSLAEAVAIVLLVSFFSLGKRPGMVVALAIPLVLAMTFAAMNYFDIGLHKISLGALVLALGLLVDDAIIAVEMMAVKMEQGMDRMAAASFAYTSTAFPMLTGTLVTAAGFLPIATAQSGTGEYTRSIFQVVTIALLLSWIAAVGFIPFLGDAYTHCLAFASLARGAGGTGADASGGSTRSLRQPFLPPAARLDRLVRRQPQHGHRPDRARLRGLDRAVPLRAAAVLPLLDAAGAGGRPGAGRGRLAHRDRSDGAALREGTRLAQGPGQLRRLGRHRFAALLPALRPEAAAIELRAVRAADAGRGGAREDSQLGDRHAGA
jgi:multidrug efflux pump